MLGGVVAAQGQKLRVRLPLLKLTVAVENPGQLAPFTDLIADELNVKAVELTDDIAAFGRFELAVNARVAGPRIGKDVQAAIKAVKSGHGVVNSDGTLTAGPATLLPQEYSSKLVAADPEFTAALPDGAGLVVLDGTVTPNSKPRAGPRTGSANYRICGSRRASRCRIASASPSKCPPTSWPGRKRTAT